MGWTPGQLALCILLAVIGMAPNLLLGMSHDGDSTECMLKGGVVTCDNCSSISLVGEAFKNAFKLVVNGECSLPVEILFAALPGLLVMECSLGICALAELEGNSCTCLLSTTGVSSINPSPDMDTTTGSSSTTVTEAVSGLYPTDVTLAPVETTENVRFLTSTSETDILNELTESNPTSSQNKVEQTPFPVSSWGRLGRQAQVALGSAAGVFFGILILGIGSWFGLRRRAQQANPIQAGSFPSPEPVGPLQESAANLAVCREQAQDGRPVLLDAKADDSPAPAPILAASELVQDVSATFLPPRSSTENRSVSVHPGTFTHFRMARRRLRGGFGWVFGKPTPRTDKRDLEMPIQELDGEGPIGNDKNQNSDIHGTPRVLQTRLVENCDELGKIRSNLKRRAPSTPQSYSTFKGTPVPPPRAPDTFLSEGTNRAPKTMCLTDVRPLNILHGSTKLGAYSLEAQMQGRELQLGLSKEGDRLARLEQNCQSQFRQMWQQWGILRSAFARLDAGRAPYNVPFEINKSSGPLELGQPGMFNDAKTNETHSFAMESSGLFPTFEEGEYPPLPGATEDSDLSEASYGSVSGGNSFVG